MSKQCKIKHLLKEHLRLRNYNGKHETDHPDRHVCRVRKTGVRENRRNRTVCRMRKQSPE
jgi:hypothetical protein